MESGSYAYTVGRCEIIDDVVYVTALTESQTGQLQATLPPWDREIAYSQRDGSVSLTNHGSDGDSTFELVASGHEAGTTWEWTVSGSDVTVEARMANRSAASEYRDVTIDIGCSGGPFGSGIYAEQFAAEEFYPIEPPSNRVPGSVTIGLDGSVYEISYLTTCGFFSEDVTAEGTANEASVYLYSEGRGVQLNLLIGDRRAEEDGMHWNLPPDAELQDDFLFRGSDTERTWSGAIVSDDGSDATATITVECTEGDAFQTAGSASVVLDGVTHDLDEVTACTIDGTTIDFFGSSTESDVAVVVTGGGSQILLADEAGGQTATRDVEFEVSGQRATWTGILAGDRQATITISCG